MGRCFIVAALRIEWLYWRRLAYDRSTIRRVHSRHISRCWHSSLLDWRICRYRVPLKRGYSAWSAELSGPCTILWCKEGRQRMGKARSLEAGSARALSVPCSGFKFRYTNTKNATRRQEQTTRQIRVVGFTSLMTCDASLIPRKLKINFRSSSSCMFNYSYWQNCSIFRVSLDA